MSARGIKKIVTGHPTQDGAGVKLVRVLGNGTVDDFDPFLMLDAFDSTDPDDYIRGFPWHPHRGIETITYLVEGRIDHGDSLGNSGTIRSGECQWMTAGSGIIHQEMPQPAERMLGLQFWLNLPRAQKMTLPKYHGATREQVPVAHERGAVIRLIAGDYHGQKGALTPEHIKAVFIDVSVEPETEWFFQADAEATIYLYILEGQAEFDDTSGQVSQKHAVLFTPGDEIRVKAGPEGVRFVLCQARPLHEPVAWGGPIVMNTREELNQAFEELDNNTFIKHGAASS
ncbi:pirin family protein [Deltaproteobacteria bacterium Smac51]|nr:pirin family protein [Deltaproteobacteria bacterium Smac51]